MSQEPHSYATYLTDPVDDSLFLRPTNDEEFLNEINQLKNKVTLDVRVSLIKYVKQEIIGSLVIIFNKSFWEGCFQEILKIAKVIPIYKGDDAANPNNNRPISLQSVFDKLLEKLMYNRLDSFLHKHKIFYKYQFGFRKNHATTNALTEVTDYIYEGNYVFGIYIDLKKPKNKPLTPNFDRGLKMGTNVLKYKESTIYLGDCNLTFETQTKKLN